jgi:LPXTG-motif cell wall-anchored protein
VNLLRTPLRRTTALVAGAFLGLAGAVALVSPASAHVADLTGPADCVQDGGWKIDWTLQIGRGPSDGTITNLHETTRQGEPVTGASALAKFVENGTVPKDGSITETQTLPVEVRSVKLSFTVVWSDNYRVPVEATIHQPRGCCPPKSPTPTPTPSETTTPPTTPPTTTPTTPPTTVAPTPSETTQPTPSVSPTTTPVPGTGGGSSSGGGGPLPVTGSAASTIAGGAAVLLVLGGALFFLARRRRVKFTA